jgi:hypothetical protein
LLSINDFLFRTAVCKFKNEFQIMTGLPRPFLRDNISNKSYNTCKNNIKKELAGYKILGEYLT